MNASRADTRVVSEWLPLYYRPDGVLVEYREKGDEAERRERKVPPAESVEAYMAAQADPNAKPQRERGDDEPMPAPNLAELRTSLQDHFKVPKSQREASA